MVHGDLPRQHPFGTTLRFTQQRCYHHLQQVQSLMPHNYISLCTVYTVAQQSVIVITVDFI